MEIVAQIVGLVGVAIVLLAYYLLAASKLTNNDARYYWLNIVGTLSLLYSLLYQWNLPSVIAQAVWITISVVGLLRLRWRAKSDA